jgi:hypothetical protein
MNNLLVHYLPVLGPTPDIHQLTVLTRDGKGLFDYIKAQNRVSMDQMAKLLPHLNQSIQKLEQNASKILAFS